MPPPSIRDGGSVQQGLSAAYDFSASSKHRPAADKRCSLDCANKVAACPTVCDVPSGTMLASCRDDNAYADCYRINQDQTALLSEYIEAFYTSAIFKLERGILGLVRGKGATDADARALAKSDTITFAIWKVEGRSPTEILLSAGRTRSWLSVNPSSTLHSKGPVLLFGSAVYPDKNQRSGMGLPFHALLGFHRLYSKALLASAASRLPAIRGRNGET